VVRCGKIALRGDHHRPMGEPQRAVNGSSTGPSEPSRTAGPLLLTGREAQLPRQTHDCRCTTGVRTAICPPSRGLAALLVPLFPTGRVARGVSISGVLCTAVRTPLHSRRFSSAGLSWSSFGTRITHFALAGRVILTPPRGALAVVRRTGAAERWSKSARSSSMNAVASSRWLIAA
jgi:hypothetical protein